MKTTSATSVQQMSRIAALSTANTAVSDKVLNTQTRSAHYRAKDCLDPNQLELTEALEEEPRGFHDLLDVGALNYG